MTIPVLRVDLWSDVVCPWCHLGARRLRAAADAFDEAVVEIRLHSFEIDPDAPAFAPGRPGPTMAEHLGSRFGGGPEAGLAMMAQVSDLAAAEDMTWHMERTRRVNTHAAHRLLAVTGRELGADVQWALGDALHVANFSEGRDVSDPAVLLALAEAAGVPRSTAGDAVHGEDGEAEVRDDRSVARQLGVTGVPFAVVGERFAVAGAQPRELYAEALRRAGEPVA